MTLPYSAAFGSLITATATNAGKDTSEFSAPVTALPPGKKGDVAPRPNGDGLIQSDDVVQVQRFQIGLDPIVSGSNEFKRADSAPLSVGDGLIQSNDVVQAQRFQIGLDPLQNVGAHSDGESPMSDWAESVSELVGRPQSEAFAKTGMGTSARFPPRRLRIEPTRISSNEVTANILVDATGIEAAYDLLSSMIPGSWLGPTFP